MAYDTSVCAPLSNQEIVLRSYSLIKDCVYFQMRKYRIPFQFRGDIEQDLVLTLLEYDNERMNTMFSKNRLNAFITEVLRRQLWSKTSIFYRRYMRWHQYSKDITDPQYKFEDD